MGRIQVHGHRGARARMPENSIAAFEYAISVGVDAIEMDVTLTPDRRVVISHDPVADASGLPSLGDALQLAGRGKFEFNIEMKGFPEHPRYAPPEEFARLVLDPLRPLSGRVMIQSFDFTLLAAVKSRAPEMPLSPLIAGDRRPFEQIAAGFEMISPEFHLATAAKVAAAHRAGLKVLVWTVNTPEDWERMIAAQVDAIITDNPAELVRRLG